MDSRQLSQSEDRPGVTTTKADFLSSFWRSQFWFVAVVAAVMLVPVVLWGWLASEMRANALAVALADERRVTQALGEHTLRLLEAQAFALDLVDHEAGERDCPALDTQAQDLIRLAAQSPQTEALWIINADGFLCMANDPARMDARNRSFRDYFSGARETPPGRYYVDRAIIGIANSIPLFTVAKARRKNGAFNGVVLASVSLTELVHYWQTVIGNLPTQRIALFREDGATIARSWQPLVPAPDPAAERRIAAVWQTAPDGGAAHASAIDGALRVTAWQSLPDWGVVVTSSVDKDVVLAPWRRSALIYGFVALLASALLGRLAWSLVRERRMLGALHASEARLALFIDRAPAAIAMFDADMRYLAVSRRFTEDYALTSFEPEALLGRSHYGVFPTFPDHMRAIHRRVLAGETLSADDDPFQREDGRCDRVRWEMTPWYRGDGRPGGALLFSEVVTERKRTEAALRESEARFRAAVQAVSGILWTNNAKGEMAGEQPGWAALTGQSQEDYQGYGWAKALHPDDARPTIDAWNAAVAERRPFVFEHRVRRHDGTWRRFAIRAIPVLDEDGTVREWVGVHTDVTEQREAEAAVAESEARLRDLLETLNLGTFTTTNFQTGLIRFWSKGCERLYGWTASEAIGQVVSDLLRTTFLTPLPGIRAGLERNGEWTGDVLHVTRDGRELTIATRAVLRRDRDGRPHEILTALTDVTAQRRAEAELAELNRYLEEKVREEVAAREDAQARAAHAQRMQALGQLAGGIAHDFNNILQAVQSGAALIEHRAADPANVKNFARTLIAAAERGAAITRRLLAFARRGDLRAERIDPAGLLDSLRDVLAQTLGSPITVRVETGSQLPAVMADRGQLETVLVNLATNARDAMPGGGTLTLAAAAEEVPAAPGHPAGLQPGEYVRLAVTDTGTGMDRTTLDHALEPFFTTKSQDKGTGLGLSMAKGFAEQSGGTLAIESAPGRGTTVTLWLPVADMLTEAVRVRPGLAAAGGLARARVLVVEDEDTVREMLVASLEAAGFAVLAASNGAEALALLEAEEAVDALISDLFMPGMGGLAVIREAHVRRPGLPAVLLTGYAGEAAHLAVSGALPGAFSLLRKPVSIAQLVDRIEMVLAARTRAAG